MDGLQIIPLTDTEEIAEGTEISSWIAKRIDLADGDVVVVSSKVVSKSEGHLVRRKDIVPSHFAYEVAERTRHDPVYCEVVLRESRDIVRMAPGVILCRTRHGFVLANAGVDESNCPDGCFVVLPPDPDSSAERIRDGLLTLTGKKTAVILSDTFGRAWRIGQTDLAVGISGMAPMRDYQGTEDRYGRKLSWTCLADADELASAAELVRGKADGVPVVVIRGYHPKGDGHIGDMLMPAERDLFR